MATYVPPPDDKFFETLNQTQQMINNVFDLAVSIKNAKAQEASRALEAQRTAQLMTQTDRNMQLAELEERRRQIEFWTSEQGKAQAQQIGAENLIQEQIETEDRKLKQVENKINHFQQYVLKNPTAFGSMTAVEAKTQQSIQEANQAALKTKTDELNQQALIFDNVNDMTNMSLSPINARLTALEESVGLGQALNPEQKAEYQQLVENKAFLIKQRDKALGKSPEMADVQAKAETMGHRNFLTYGQQSDRMTPTQQSQFNEISENLTTRGKQELFKAIKDGVSISDFVSQYSDDSLVFRQFGVEAIENQLRDADTIKRIQRTTNPNGVLIGPEILANMGATVATIRSGIPLPVKLKVKTPGWLGRESYTSQTMSQETLNNNVLKDKVYLEAALEQGAEKLIRPEVLQEANQKWFIQPYINELLKASEAGEELSDEQWKMIEDYQTQLKTKGSKKPKANK